jgi:hypothetical protein
MSLRFAPGRGSEKKKIEQLNLLQVELWPCKGLEKDTRREVGFDLVPLVSYAEKKAPLRNFRDGQELYLPQECGEHCIKMFQVVLDPEAGCTARSA